MASGFLLICSLGLPEWDISKKRNSIFLNQALSPKIKFSIMIFLFKLYNLLDS